MAPCAPPVLFGSVGPEWVHAGTQWRRASLTLGFSLSHGSSMFLCLRDEARCALTATGAVERGPKRPPADAPRLGLGVVVSRWRYGSSDGGEGTRGRTGRSLGVGGVGSAAAPAGRLRPRTRGVTPKRRLVGEIRARPRQGFDVPRPLSVAGRGDGRRRTPRLRRRSRGAAGALGLLCSIAAMSSAPSLIPSVLALPKL